MSVSNLVYMVEIQGLEAAQRQADSAAKSADMATASIEKTEKQGRTLYPVVFNLMGAITNTRQALTQLTEGIREMNPILLLSAFVNMLQVVNNLNNLMRTLQTSTAAAAAAQGVLAALAGNWYLIPLALASGALILSSLKSYQTGGPVTKTGVYMLHQGEYVVPANQVSYGPIFLNFGSAPRGSDVNRLVRDVGPLIAERLRRGF